MASPEPIVASNRLRRAALAERERLSRELERLEDRLTALRSELHAGERQRSELRERLALLTQLAHDEEADSPFALRALSDASSDEVPSEIDAPLGVLRGGDIRVTAVRVLASSENPTRPIHYQRWYELVREAGYAIAGKDPTAAFLTQLTRSPVVRRTGAPGTYALDLDTPRRLRDRLNMLSSELLLLHEGQQTLEAITSIRDRRLELTAEYERVERALTEALEAFGLTVPQETLPGAGEVGNEELPSGAWTA